MGRGPRSPSTIIETKDKPFTDDDISLINSQAMRIIACIFPEMNTAPPEAIGEAFRELIKAKLTAAISAPATKPAAKRAEKEALAYAYIVMRNHASEIDVENNGGSKPMDIPRANNIVDTYNQTLPDTERFKEIVGRKRGGGMGGIAAG